MTESRDDAHVFGLGYGTWSVWREAVLRSTGFPVSGLTVFAAPECAGAADELIAGQAERATFDKAFDEEVARLATAVHGLAGDPLVRTAVAWQSRDALIGFDRLRAAGPHPRRTARYRRRERMVAMYWQRYCGKAETIGFFGPACWAVIDPDEPGVTLRVGAQVIGKRAVFFDYWPLAALADRLAADPAVRPWLPPRLAPHLTLRGREVLDPVRPPVTLTPAQAAAAAHCDGRRAAAGIADELTAMPGFGLRRREDVYLMLDQLVRRGILRWDFNLPVSLQAEQVLRDRIGAIADPAARAAAERVLGALAAARDRVATASSAARGDGELASALGQLEEVFAQETGLMAYRRPGQAYAGRTICTEETARDLDVRFGRPVIDAIAEPLAVLLAITRWLCAELAREYLAELGEIHDSLAAEAGRGGGVGLGQLWLLAQNAFYGRGRRPVDRVRAELTRRWTLLLGLDEARIRERRLAFCSRELSGRLAELFPGGPAWPAARVHSPDIQLCAAGAGELARGDFQAVLGEMHAAWPTATGAAFTVWHPDPGRLRRALRRDLGEAMVYPLLPLDWPRNTPRLAFALEDPADIQLGIAPAPGSDPGRLVPISSLTVRRGADGLAAVSGDGRSWPLAGIFGRLLSELAVEAFKVTTDGPHTPRITIDRLVAVRESWRTSAAGCPLGTARGEREEYLAARRWKAELGLPDHVFVKAATETKPVFADLTSPACVSMVASIIRACRRAAGDTAAVTVSEMLPAPEQAWLPDADGQRYLSELRLQIRDDAMAAGACASSRESVTR